MNRADITQYRVSFRDAPRTRAMMSQLLATEKIRSEAQRTAKRGDRIEVYFLAQKSARLREKLERTGAAVAEDQVFQVELPKRGAALDRLTKALEDADIKIISLYSVVEGDSMRMILAVDEPANAVALASSLGFDPDYYVFEM